MPGPFDDPTQFAQIQGANGPFSVPTSIASRFHPPLTVPAIDPTQAAPLTVGGVPIPADIASRFAPAPAPVVPPVATPQGKPVPISTTAPAKPAPVQSPLAAAQSTTESGLAERKQAAIDLGGSQAASAEAQADAIAEGNRQADLARAAAAKQAEQDKAEQQRMSADLSAAQKAYADHKVDQNRFWHDSSTGSKVLMGIGLALSAAGSVLKHEGAKNPALDMIMGAVKQDVALQLADRDKLGNVVGQKGSALDRMMAITRDNQATAQAAIAASLDRVKGQVAEIAARAQSPAAKANALDLHGQLTIEEGKAKAAAEETMYQRKKDDQQLAIQRQNTAIAGGHLALAGKQFEEGKRQYDLSRGDAFYKEAMDALQKGSALAAKMKGGDLESKKAALEVEKLQQEIGTKNLEQVVLAPPTMVETKNADGTVTKALKAVPVTAVDGSPLQIPKEEAAKLRAKIGGAIFYSGAADQLLAWREKHGWESKAWNSEDRQTAEVLVRNLQIAAKNAFQLGALSDSDLNLVTGAVGVDDPGSYRDPSAAILKGREMTWAGVNADLASHGGAPVSMPPPGTADVKNSPTQQLISDAQERNRTDTSTIVARAKDGLDAPTPSGAGMSAKAIKATVSLAATAAGRLKAGPEAQAEALRALEDQANSSNQGAAILARRQIDAYQLPVKDPWWRAENILTSPSSPWSPKEPDWAALGLTPPGGK